MTYHRYIRHRTEHSGFPVPIMHLRRKSFIPARKLRQQTTPSLTTVTTPAGGSGGMNAPSAGLMDFAPLWSTPATPITTVNASTLVAPSIIPSVATTKQHILGGIVNPEAYCDLCRNKIWNKYFIKMHKAKMLRQMEAEQSTTTFRLWLHPADRRTRTQAFALHLVLVVAFCSDGSTTSCSSSSSSSGRPRQQQLFSPERLRQMGIINAEEFGEICCQ